MIEPVLAGKMKRKPGDRAAMINAPLGCQTGSFDLIRVFVGQAAELRRLAPSAAQALKPERLLWPSFPKGSSGNQSDLTRAKGWNTLRQSELKWVALISVNETWSASALRHYNFARAAPHPRVERSYV